VIFFAIFANITLCKIVKHKKNMNNISAALIQSQFLKRIEDILDSSTSLVFELSELLEISTDSAYRRMRGETLLNIDEIIKLCNRFKISFDAFSQPETGMVTFSYGNIENKSDSLLNFLQSLRNDLLRIQAVPNSHIIYACQDIPVFYHYAHHKLAAFKFFYWMRSIMNISDIDLGKYNPDLISSEIYETAINIYNLYANVPSTEIWTDTTIQSTIKQIGFYWEAGIFNNKHEVLEICESLRSEILNIQKQAESSTKINANSKIQSETNNYNLYFSEIEITNNCVLVDLNLNKAVYLSHFSFYTMKTMNDNYCLKTQEWLNSLIKKTTLISGVSEKIRHQFFNKAYKEIDKLIDRIES